MPSVVTPTMDAKIDPLHSVINATCLPSFRSPMLTTDAERIEELEEPCSFQNSLAVSPLGSYLSVDADWGAADVEERCRELKEMERMELHASSPYRHSDDDNDHIHRDAMAAVDVGCHKSADFAAERQEGVSHSSLMTVRPDAHDEEEQRTTDGSSSVSVTHEHHRHHHRHHPRDQQEMLLCDMLTETKMAPLHVLEDTACWNSNATRGVKMSCCLHHIPFSLTDDALMQLLRDVFSRRVLMEGINASLRAVPDEKKAFLPPPLEIQSVNVLSCGASLKGGQGKRIVSFDLRFPTRQHYGSFAREHGKLLQDVFFQCISERLQLFFAGAVWWCGFVCEQLNVDFTSAVGATTFDDKARLEGQLHIWNNKVTEVRNSSESKCGREKPSLRTTVKFKKNFVERRNGV